MKKVIKTIFLSVVWGFVSGPLQAGTLRDFEADATRKTDAANARSKASQTNSAREGDDKSLTDILIVEPLVNAIFLPVFDGMVTGAINSYRYSLDKFDFVKPDIGGNDDALLPFFRLDSGKHFVSKHIDGNELKAMAGFGPMAVEFRQNRYWETGDPIELKLNQWSVHYRALAYNRIALGLSIGETLFTGKEAYSGTNFHLPVLIRVNRDLYFALEAGMQAIDNGSSVGDYLVELRYGSHYLSAYFGYHWLNTSHTFLRGSTAGLAFYF